MEFATLDKMIKELEEEKNAYVKSMEKKIDSIKKSVEKMKDEYRKETMPEVTGMVDYLLERAKKRLGDKIIEASDIPEDVMDDFYEVTKRKVDTKRVVLGHENGCSVARYWFFFTDKELYLWRRNKGYSVYTYEAIKDLKINKTYYSKDVDMLVDWKDCKEQSGEDLRYVLKLMDSDDEAIVRLLLDLRDFANRSK